jgi:hypothetical protein
MQEKKEKFLSTIKKIDGEYNGHYFNRGKATTNDRIGVDVRIYRQRNDSM